MRKRVLLVLIAMFALCLFAPASAQAATITTQIDLSANPASTSGDNWEWNQATETLTLQDGFDLRITAATAQNTAAGILLPDGATVYVAGTANVDVSAGLADTSSIVVGIDGNGNLTLDGTGTLTVKAHNTESTGNYAGGIGADDALAVASTFTGTVDATGDQFGLGAGGVVTLSGGTILSKATADSVWGGLVSTAASVLIENCDVTANSNGTAAYNSGIYAGTSQTVTIDNAVVHVTVADANAETAGIQGVGGVAIQNGSQVTVSGGRNGIKGGSIAISDSTVDSAGQSHGIDGAGTNGVSITNSTVTASQDAYMGAGLRCLGALSVTNSTLTTTATGTKSTGLLLNDNGNTVPASFTIENSKVDATGTATGMYFVSAASTSPLILGSGVAVQEGGTLASLLNDDRYLWSFSPTGSITFEGGVIVGASTHVVIAPSTAPQTPDAADASTTTLPTTGDKPAPLALFALLAVAALALIGVGLRRRV